jgi:hypothetical protein
MISPFRNLTEPLIETPRERIAPDGVGMNVRLDGTGATDGSGRFVCGSSVRLRGAKRVKGCMARIVPNYSALGSEISRNGNKHALPVSELTRVLVRFNHVAAAMRFPLPPWILVVDGSDR